MPNKTSSSVLSIAVMSVLCIQGCSTLSHDYSKSGQDYYSQDVIQYVGFPIYLGIRQKGVILNGKEYDYLISLGENELETLLQQSALSNSSAFNNSSHNSHVFIKQPLNIYRYPDNSVNIVIDYEITNTIPINQETENHNNYSQLCHTLNKTGNTEIGRGRASRILISNSKGPNKIECQLQVQGGIYKAIDLNTESLRLNGELSATIYNMADKRQPSITETRVIPLQRINQALNLSTEIMKLGEILSGF